MSEDGAARSPVVGWARSRLAVIAQIAAQAALAGCSGAPARQPAPPPDRPSGDDEIQLARQYSELEDDIFRSYDRDEPPELGTGMIDPRIGAVRIGVGPDDIHFAGDPASRWPLDIDRSSRSVRSKRLEIQISVDRTAGWMADELSWRIETCHRTAVVPLRITALYAQDGDRWVLVFEHLSFARTPTPADVPDARPIRTVVASGDLRDELSGVLARGLFQVPHDPAVVAQSGGARVLGPDVADEWYGPRVLEAQLPAGTLEDRRVGLVGRDPQTATVAYWIGSYAASIPARQGVPAGKVRMRVTHVFEKRWFDSPAGPPTEGKSCGLDEDEAKDRAKRDAVASHCRWVLVQSHMSQPIRDDDLACRVFGSALVSSGPLRLDCSEGPPSTPGSCGAHGGSGGSPPAAPAPTAPGAGPRPAAARPAAGTP